ncbi:MAG: hypothetical protein JW828_06095 [Sedimentisphaerales bacterium]|nr:hypothetical protein [Sedimentisphaerales bacterium]
MKFRMLVWLWACLFIHTAYAIDGNISGQGTKADPYQIADTADLQTFADPTYGNVYWAAGVYTLLVADIDLDGISIPPIGIPPINFMGHFDGGGHVISNVQVQLLSWNTVGLFMNVWTTASIRNLGLENVTIHGQKTYAGGLAGYNGGSISHCHVSGSVEGYYQVGGLAGWNDTQGQILNCSSAADVSVSASDNHCTAGGLVGQNDGKIMGCRATGNVHGYSGKSFGVVRTGSLIGTNDEGRVENCYATGNASAEATVGQVGGLIGQNDDGLVINCFSMGTAFATATSAAYIGGLCGVNGGTIRASFCCMSPSCGHISWPGMEQNVFCVSATGMQVRSLFTDVGWDFVDDGGGVDDVWRMCADGVYPPRLWWEFPPGDIACPDGVAIADVHTLAAYWLADDSDLTFYENADLNVDGRIDMQDFVVLADRWIQ